MQYSTKRRDTIRHKERWQTRQVEQDKANTTDTNRGTRKVATQDETGIRRKGDKTNKTKYSKTQQDERYDSARLDETRVRRPEERHGKQDER